MFESITNKDSYKDSYKYNYDNMWTLYSILSDTIYKLLASSEAVFSLRKVNLVNIETGDCLCLHMLNSDDKYELLTVKWLN